PERGRRLAAALAWLWHFDRHGHEGLSYLQRAVGCAPDDRSALQARLSLGVALVADTAQPLEPAYDGAHRALDIATQAGQPGRRGERGISRPRSASTGCAPSAWCSPALAGSTPTSTRPGGSQPRRSRPPSGPATRSSSTRPERSRASSSTAATGTTRRSRCCR